MPLSTKCDYCGKLMKLDGYYCSQECRMKDYQERITEHQSYIRELEEENNKLVSDTKNLILACDDLKTKLEDKHKAHYETTREMLALRDEKEKAVARCREAERECEDIRDKWLTRLRQAEEILGGKWEKLKVVVKSEIANLEAALWQPLYKNEGKLHGELREANHILNEMVKLEEAAAKTEVVSKHDK